MDPVLSYNTSQERQPAVVPELPDNKPHQSPKQSHAEDHTEQIEATREEDPRWRTGRLQSRKEHHRADRQPTPFPWKYLQHQQDLYSVVIDFKKAFDRVWHPALWPAMKKYNRSTNLIQVIKNLYDKATSAVPFNNSIGDLLKTTIGVRQGCLLSLTLFNIFLERIMTGALEDHEGTVSIGGRTITNLRFADDINGLAGGEEEMANLAERLDKASTAYGVDISSEKTKLMTNNTSGINTGIK